MAVNEAGVVTAICKAIRKEYPSAWIFKVVGSPYQMSGVPDLLVCVDGLLAGLEVKHQKLGESEQAARERTSAVQRVQIAQINRAGGIAGTVLNEYEALDLIGRGLANREKARDDRREAERG